MIPTRNELSGCLKPIKVGFDIFANAARVQVLKDMTIAANGMHCALQRCKLDVPLLVAGLLVQGGILGRTGYTAGCQDLQQHNQLKYLAGGPQSGFTTSLIGVRYGLREFYGTYNFV